MKNLAYRGDDPEVIFQTHQTLMAELEEAGIHHILIPRVNSEVPYQVIGLLGGFWFTREWYYWVARPAKECNLVLPFAYADPLHEAHGSYVRVNGDCTAPSPQEQYKPNRGQLGVDCYHVDTQEGLNALADTLRLFMKEIMTDSPYDRDLATWRRLLGKEGLGSSMMKTLLGIEKLPEVETA